MAQKPAKNADLRMNFKNMCENPPYALTEINHSTYMATHHPSPWHEVAGWTLHSTVYDFMRNVYLGSAKIFIASAIRFLLEKGVFDSFGWERDSLNMFSSITLSIQDTFKRNKPLDFVPFLRSCLICKGQKMVE